MRTINLVADAYKVHARDGSHDPDKLSPQGLCTCCSSAWMLFPSDFYQVHSLRSSFNWLPSRQSFPGHLLKLTSLTLTPFPCDIFLRSTYCYLTHWVLPPHPSLSPSLPYFFPSIVCLFSIECTLKNHGNCVYRRNSGLVSSLLLHNRLS